MFDRAKFDEKMREFAAKVAHEQDSLVVAYLKAHPEVDPANLEVCHGPSADGMTFRCWVRLRGSGA